MSWGPWLDLSWSIRSTCEDVAEITFKRFLVVHLFSSCFHLFARGRKITLRGATSVVVALICRIIIDQRNLPWLCFWNGIRKLGQRDLVFKKKAQRTRGLSSSCQSNFLRSYNKSWSHFIFRISTKHQLKILTKHQHLH